VQAMTTAEDDRRVVCQALKERGNGSVLRGWRKELDPQGTFEIGFLDFCNATPKLGVAVDVPRLFGEDSPDTLELVELAPAEGGLVKRFLEWMKEEFGGPGELYVEIETLVGSDDGTLSRDGFVRGCKERGFAGEPEELIEIFNLLDVLLCGKILLEDAMFMETDQERRTGAANKSKWKAQHQHQKVLLSAYRLDVQSRLPKGHRMCQRMWHAASMERLPEIVSQKTKDRRNFLHTRKTQAHEKFVEHLRKKFGHEVRAWRRVLDVKGRWYVTRAETSAYCCRANLDIHFRSLWASLDPDNDGHFLLEEIGGQCAASLANFRVWAKKNFGTCEAVWDEFDSAGNSMTAPPDMKWNSFKKIRYGAFIKLLHVLGWTKKSDEAHLTCKALDYFGCGFISQSDLEWLEAWKSCPPWISAEPDEEAAQQFREVLLRECGTPLNAWRTVLDTDDSNFVTWDEFKDGCKKIGFKGNMGGVWRHFDDDISGSITLNEFDPDSAELLSSFKEWVEEHYGCVSFAFKSIDSDGTGSVMFVELNRACQKKNWEGDVRALFACLDKEVVKGKRNLSYKDLEFLDEWAPDDSRKAVDEEYSRPATSPVSSPARSPAHWTRIYDDWSAPLRRSLSQSNIGDRFEAKFA